MPSPYGVGAYLPGRERRVEEVVFRPECHSPNHAVSKRTRRDNSAAASFWLISGWLPCAARAMSRSSKRAKRRDSSASSAGSKYGRLLSLFFGFFFIVRLRQ